MKGFDFKDAKSRKNHECPGRLSLKANSKLMTEFEELYLRVREKEKRLYTDAEVMQLPAIASSHPHYREWVIRHASYKALENYLWNKNSPLKILDIGCGNGWLTSRLSAINNSPVTGIDINRFEIEQAKRVFGGKERLNFHSGNIFNDELFHEKQFNVIVMAASIQYFNDIQKLFAHLLTLLRNDGEIHIIDSPFYEEKKIRKAHLATHDYYRHMSCEKMAEHYHHHLWSALDSFNYTVLNRSLADNTFRFFNRTRNYFPWVRIKK
jgi:ubiquinone/menaquinone biosynthesis C-methylase UbiE